MSRFELIVVMLEGVQLLVLFIIAFQQRGD